MWIGIISAVPAVTRFTVLPLVTGLGREALFAARRPDATAFITAFGFSSWEPSTGAAGVPGLCGDLLRMDADVPLTDAYALRGVARYGLNYGPLRLWGSAGVVGQRPVERVAVIRQAVRAG